MFAEKGTGYMHPEARFQKNDGTRNVRLSNESVELVDWRDRIK